MNARQKSKKYKKECERLKSIMLATKVQSHLAVNQHSIVTLRAEQLVDLAELYKISASEECEISMLNKMLATQLLHQILNYAKIEICGNPYGYSDNTLIRATMKVVDMRMDGQIMKQTVVFDFDGVIYSYTFDRMEEAQCQEY